MAQDADTDCQSTKSRYRYPTPLLFIKTDVMFNIVVTLLC